MQKSQTKAMLLTSAVAVLAVAGFLGINREKPAPPVVESTPVESTINEEFDHTVRPSRDEEPPITRIRPGEERDDKPPTRPTKRTKHKSSDAMGVY